VLGGLGTDQCLEHQREPLADAVQVTAGAQCIQQLRQGRLAEGHRGELLGVHLGRITLSFTRWPRLATQQAKDQSSKSTTTWDAYRSRSPDTSEPASPGAHLGHGARDSRGQPRFPTDSRESAFTSVNAREQQPLCGHAVYGMQGVRGSNPLSSTTTTPQVTAPPFIQRRFLALPGCPIRAARVPLDAGGGHCPLGPMRPRSARPGRPR
jgi:hypothetical protein